MYDLVIKDGTIVTAERSFQADVGIVGEEIAAIGLDLEGNKIINAKGKLVTPGAVDVHVHLSLDLGPGLISADNFAVGTRAAACGGTTSIIDFVHPAADQSMQDALAERQAEADPLACIDYALHMNISPHHMDALSDLKEIADAGITTYKLYMAYGLALNDSQLLRALEAIRDVGGLPVVHAENWDIITTLIDRYRTAGHTEAIWHPRSRPVIMEAEAAGRIIDMAEYVGIPMHIFHIGCKATADRVARARSRGLPIYGETCPQYMLLTDEVYERPGLEGTYGVCAPPLRPAEDQEAIWRALANGELQIISTDHCPWTQEQKSRGLNDFSLIPGGVPGIEIRFPAIYSAGVRTGKLTPEQWIRLCCTQPANLHHLDRKGHILPGYDADLVIFDPEIKVILTADKLHSAIEYTPYEGMELQGWPAVTISRGKIIYQGQEFVGAEGWGRYIARYR